MVRNINRWLCKKSVTHLLLDGGTLSVKEGFHEDYICDVLNNERLCVVEKKTQLFRFFVDVDYVGEQQLDFEKVAVEISKVVDAGPCVIAKAAPRNTEKGTKYGMHMIWPESAVNKQRANSIRVKILDEFGPDEWEKIIDGSVYSGSGLRMLWSYKKEHDSTPYVPWGKIDEHGTFREFTNKDPSVHFLDLFSIRIQDQKFLEETVIGGSDHCELETFIRKNMPGQEKTKITRVGKCKNKKDYWVRTDSRYCENVKREHKSNHVWFVLSPKGTIGQMCEDETCKGWKGRLYRIPSRLIPNEGVLDGCPRRNINDYLPDGWRRTTSFIV
jgi:hypothetical protein